MKSKRAFIVDLACVFLLISFCLIIALPRWRAGIDWSDEGFLAYGAVRVMEGQVPHRDFVSLQPPLSFYITAIIFKLFGTSLLTLRIFGVSIFFLVPLLIYGIGRILTKPMVSLAAAIPACILSIPLFNFVPFAVWQGITASLAAVFLYLHATLRQRRLLAFSAGVLTAASLLLRHDQAVYLILSIFILTVALRVARDGAFPPVNLNRVLVLWVGGATALLLPLLIYWWAQGALPEMFRQLLVFPITTYRKTSGLPFPRISTQTTLSQKAIALLFYIPPFFQSIAAIYLAQRAMRRRFRLQEVILSFLLIWSALFYLQVLTRSDLNHLLITLPPFFLLAAYGWQLLLEKIRNNRKIDIVVSIAAAALVGYFLRLLQPVVLPDRSNEDELLALDRGGVRMEKAHLAADFIRQVQNYVPPTRSILVLPYQPMFYFLCERRNPTRWNYLWPGDQTASDHQLLIEQAKRDAPAVVLLSLEEEMTAYAPAILDYVHREYTKSGQYAYLAIYVQREP